MERDRSRTGETVKREERGRWRDAGQREGEQVEATAERMEAERMERERMERERVERERLEAQRMERDRVEREAPGRDRTDRDRDRERSERERRGMERMERGELAGRGMGGASPLAPRDPLIASHFDFMRQFMREMSRMFEGLGYPGRAMGGSGSPGVMGYPGQGYQGSSQGSSLAGWPPIEVEERDGRMVIRAELPGMDLQDVRVSLEGNYLLIEGERREDRNREREGYYESEWSYGQFSRRIPMPPGVSADQIRATCDNGVLELTIDVPTRNVREIPINRTGRERVDERRSGRDRESPSRLES